MIFRTEGDIVNASNAAQNLTNLVIAYLEIYKTYAQGINDVTIPEKPYTVVFKPMRRENILPVALVYTKTSHWQQPHYYDVDSDYFQEGYGTGDTNISGYSCRTSTSTEECYIDIPFSCLLKSEEEMKQNLKDFVKRKQAEEAEKERNLRIKQLEEELNKLKERDNG